MTETKPHRCLHCALVDAINAHGKAYPDECHCERCVIAALGRCIGEIITGDTECESVPAGAVKH